MSSPAKYSRDELARLETSLRELGEVLEGRAIVQDPRGAQKRAWKADLAQAADFLAETVAVLDAQTKRSRDRKAKAAIARKKARGRRG